MIDCDWNRYDPEMTAKYRIGANGDKKDTTSSSSSTTEAAAPVLSLDSFITRVDITKQVYLLFHYY